MEVFDGFRGLDFMLSCQETWMQEDLCATELAIEDSMTQQFCKIANWPSLSSGC